jgi:hypothetical protein
VYQKASEELKERIEMYKQDDGYENCPNCGYTQSWMKPSASANRSCGLVGFLMLIISGLLGAGVAGTINERNAFLLIASAVILWILMLLTMFILVARIPQKDPNKGYGEVERKNKPTVVWSEIEFDN